MYCGKLNAQKKIHVFIYRFFFILNKYIYIVTLFVFSVLTEIPTVNVYHKKYA